MRIESYESLVLNTFPVINRIRLLLTDFQKIITPRLSVSTDYDEVDRLYLDNIASEMILPVA